jgi:hypothetical protein
MKNGKVYNPDYFYCKRCKSYLDQQDFYPSKLKNKHINCKKCCQEVDKENYVYAKENPCGSSRVPTKPNKFSDEAQKECTHNFLKLMGWKYNEINGIWWKEGFKDEDGKFMNIKTNKHTKNKKIKDSVKNEIIRLLREGYRNKEIKIITGVSLPSISQIKQNEGFSSRRDRNTK